MGEGGYCDKINDLRQRQGPGWEIVMVDMRFVAVVGQSCLASEDCRDASVMIGHISPSSKDRRQSGLPRMLPR